MLNRKVIRNLVLDKLQTFRDFEGITFYPNRKIRVADDELPVCYVFTEDETSEEYATSPKSSKRELDLVIEFHSKGKISELEDLIDDFTYNTERIMNYDRWLTSDGQRLLENSQIINTEKGFDSSSSTPLLSVGITYRLTYVTEDVSDLDQISDFNTFNGKIKIQEQISEMENSFED